MIQGGLRLGSLRVRVEFHKCNIVSSRNQASLFEPWEPEMGWVWHFKWWTVTWLAPRAYTLTICCLLSDMSPRSTQWWPTKREQFCALRKEERARFKLLSRSSVYREYKLLPIQETSSIKFRFTGIFPFHPGKPGSNSIYTYCSNNIVNIISVVSWGRFWRNRILCGTPLPLIGCRPAAGGGCIPGGAALPISMLSISLLGSVPPGEGARVWMIQN